MTEWLYCRKGRRAPAFAGVTLLFLCLASFPARAAQQCYSPKEMQAEQLLRLHSELMVITLACKQGSHGENLVPAYTSFTKDNIKALHAAEETMIAYYHRVHGGDGTPWLDRLRTRLSNEYGRKAADMSAPIFCAMYRDKVLQMCGDDAQQVEAEAVRIGAAGKSYAKLCLPRHPRIAKSVK